MKEETGNSITKERSEGGRKGCIKPRKRTQGKGDIRKRRNNERRQERRK
jgi:hypothetical protein